LTIWSVSDGKDRQNVRIVRPQEKERLEGRIGRYNCHTCKSTFKVTHGTLFQETKIPLEKWFLAISLMETNAKKSLSSCQLARDLGLKQKACWRMMMAIRAEMGKDNVFLQGIVEADETYIGGKGQKNDDKETGEPKRGRGTAKRVVLGAVARGGQVVAKIVENAKGGTIAKFIKKFVKTDASELYTDPYKGYNEIGREIRNHETLNRSETWEAGEMHTNTIEGFWSSSNGLGMVHIITIQHHTRPCILQRPAINTTTEKRISLTSFYGRLWMKTTNLKS